jgi:hypothetical protein
MQLKPKQQNSPDFIRQLLCALLCAALFCGIFSYSGEAFASAAPAVQPDAGTRYTGDLFCPYNYDGLSGRVVHCIEAIVIEAAKTFLETFLPYYEAIIISSMVLAVTIYGALIMMGSMSRPTGQTFFFLFKLSGVAFFTLQFGQMIDSIFDIMHGLLSIVTNYVTVSTLSACSDSGYLSEFFSLQRENLSVWDKIDCMFITLLGIGVAQTTLVGIAVSLSFGLVAVMTASMLTGGIGLIIFIIAIFFMLTLLFAVMRAMKIYLVSVITIAFLICISPLLIPMILFAPTRPLFDKWLKNLANYMLIPIFLFAFLSMIVAAYDAILFKGPSSLYYAIASEASQQQGFNFKDWLEFGTSGKVVRDADGTAQFNGDAPVTEGGTFVGQDVPGLDAIGIMTTREACLNGTDVDRQVLGDACEQDFDTMLECAINPMIAPEGVSQSLEEGEPCTALRDRDGYRPYYGFLRNEEMFHFAIAPNIETDMDAREARQEGCGWNVFCHIGRGASKLAGYVFNFAKQVVGAILQIGGTIASWIGSALKAIGSFVQDYCPMGGSLPGAICDVTSGAFMVVGSVVHTVGTVTNFSGRVLMNGLMAELGELFDAWFDVETIDFQKIASYRCKIENGLTNPTDVAYLQCPGPEDVIIDIIYVLIAACVVAYLMLRWLNYIPSLGSTLVGSARIETSLPGEGAVMQATSKIQHRMEQIISKRKKGGG